MRVIFKVVRGYVKEIHGDSVTIQTAPVPLEDGRVGTPPPFLIKGHKAYPVFPKHIEKGERVIVAFLHEDGAPFTDAIPISYATRRKLIFSWKRLKDYYRCFTGGNTYYFSDFFWFPVIWFVYLKVLRIFLGKTKTVDDLYEQLAIRENLGIQTEVEIFKDGN